MTRWWLRRRLRAVVAHRAVLADPPARPMAVLRLPSRPTSALRDVAAAWRQELAPSERLIQRAAELLAETDDARLFLPIAVLSRDTPTEVLSAAVVETFEAAGDSIVLTEELAGPLALRWACAATLDGRMPPQDLCRWAGRCSEWQGPDVFEVFEVLDTEYDEADFAGALPSADLDARATSAAAAFLRLSAALAG